MITSLYKFFPARVEFFDNFLLRATGKHSLNDPFEVNASTDYLIDLYLEIGDGRFGLDRDEILKFISEQPKQGRWAELGLPFYTDYGIISLTETKDNLLMWSHYADEHNGFVVEFDSRHEFFTSKFHSENNPCLGKASRVLYRKERLCNLGEYLMEPFFHKSDEWAYEKESRLILSFQDADKILVPNDKAEDLIKARGYFKQENLQKFSNRLDVIEDPMYPNNLHEHSEILFMFEVPKDSIKSITFGCRASEEFINEATSKLKQQGLNIAVQKAVMDRYDYRLRFEEIEI